MCSHVCSHTQNMTKVSCIKYGVNEKKRVSIYVFCWGNRSDCGVDWCACFEVSSLIKPFRHIVIFYNCVFLIKLGKLHKIFGENLGGNG